MTRPPPISTLFPYTTLFRSSLKIQLGRPGRGRDIETFQRFLRDLGRSEEHTSELQSHSDLVCRLLLEKKTHTCMTMTTLSSPIAWLRRTSATTRGPSRANAQ